MSSTWQLLTDRLRLRPYHPDDVTPMFAVFGDREVILLAYNDMHFPLRPGRPHGVVDHVAQDAADFRRIGMGNDLRAAHGHGGAGMKQPHPLDLAARQGPQ